MLSRCSLIWRIVSRCVTLSVSCLVMVRVISFEVVQLMRINAMSAVRMYRIIMYLVCLSYYLSYYLFYYLFYSRVVATFAVSKSI